MNIILFVLGLPLILITFSMAFSRLIRWWQPASGQFMELNGSKIHYLEKGTGEPLLLIHGLNGSSLNFDYALINELAVTFRVIAIDRPGSGHSPRPKGQSANLPHQAHIVAQVIKRLGIGPVFITGHSLGGALALELGAQYPELVKSLALISPLTQMQNEVPEAFQALKIRSPKLRWIYARTLATLVTAIRSQKMLGLLFYPDKAPRDFGLKGGGFISADYISYENASADLAALEHELERLTHQYEKIHFPVSILFGREDKILDHRTHGIPMEALGTHFKVDYVSGGHMLIATHPQVVSEFIKRSFSHS